MSVAPSQPSRRPAARPQLVQIKAPHDPAWMKRPARVQTTEVVSFTPNTSGDYNIWYNRYGGFQNREKRVFAAGEERLRCNPERDTGRTRAGQDSPICMYFAAGKCINGAKCSYKHRIPIAADEQKLSVSRDIFGRERHGNDREDMNGTGSFSRNNRTLYIEGFEQKESLGESEAMVRRHFAPFGEMEYVRVIPAKNIAFVRYCFRASAEFAKIAMADQHFDTEEDVLAIRWAMVDPNPVARKHEQRQRNLEFINAVEYKIAAMPAQQQETQDSIHKLQALRKGVYPNTDANLGVLTTAVIQEARKKRKAIGPAEGPPTGTGAAAGPVAKTKKVIGPAMRPPQADASASQAVQQQQQQWTPEQVKQYWQQYYNYYGEQATTAAAAAAASGESGEAAAAKAAGAVEQLAKADDPAVSGPAEYVAAAYYNPKAKAYFHANPNTSDAHPYASGRYHGHRFDQTNQQFNNAEASNQSNK